MAWWHDGTWWSRHPKVRKMKPDRVIMIVTQRNCKKNSYNLKSFKDRWLFFMSNAFWPAVHWPCLEWSEWEIASLSSFYLIASMNGKWTIVILCYPRTCKPPWSLLKFLINSHAFGLWWRSCCALIWGIFILVLRDSMTQRNYPFVLSDTNSREFSLEFPGIFL